MFELPQKPTFLLLLIKNSWCLSFQNTTGQCKRLGKIQRHFKSGEKVLEAEKGKKDTPLSKKRKCMKN
jgi:hypothetical protein